MLETYLILLGSLLPAIAMAFVIACGKGDWLIARYNTASKEKKAKTDIKRLRLATSVFLLTICAWCMLMPLAAYNKTLEYILLCCLAGITIVFLIIANTWCKGRPASTSHTMERKGRL